MDIGTHCSCSAFYCTQTHMKLQSEFSREFLKTIFARLPPLASAARGGQHPPRYASAVRSNIGPTTESARTRREACSTWHSTRQVRAAAVDRVCVSDRQIWKWVIGSPGHLSHPGHHFDPV